MHYYTNNWKLPNYSTASISHESWSRCLQQPHICYLTQHEVHCQGSGLRCRICLLWNDKPCACTDTQRSTRNAAATMRPSIGSWRSSRTVNQRQRSRRLSQRNQWAGKESGSVQHKLTGFWHCLDGLRKQPRSHPDEKNQPISVSDGYRSRLDTHMPYFPAVSSGKERKIASPQMPVSPPHTRFSSRG